MNTTTLQALQNPIVEKFERVASKVERKYQAKFRELTEAHRRSRFIEWISYDDDLWARLSVGHFPDEESYSAEMERVIWGRYYDSLTDEEIRAIESNIRIKAPDFYFDDSDDPDSVCFYSDGIVGLRNKWAYRVSAMRESAKELLVARLWNDPIKRADNEEDDPGDEEYHRQSAAIYAQHDVNLRIITNIDMKYSPASFICDTCGHLRHSHDETGHLIADIGMWALSNGEPVSYLACEECAAKPDVTKAILSRLFAEREQFWRMEDERKDKECRDMFLSEGIDPDTGDPIDPQPNPTGSGQTPGANTGSQSSTANNSGQTSNSTHDQKLKLIEDLKNSVLPQTLKDEHWALYRFETLPNGTVEKALYRPDGTPGMKYSYPGWTDFYQCETAFMSGNYDGIVYNLGGRFIHDTDPLAAQNTASGQQSTSGSQSSAKGSPFLSFAELMLLPPKQWLINSILGKGDIVMVYGEPGSGKTMGLIDLIFAACQGKKWANKFDVVRPLTVAYCAGEGLSGLKDRFASACDHWGVSTLPNFYVLPLAPQLFQANRADHIKEQVKLFKANHGNTLDLLVIDTLHAATAGADENSAKDMGIVLDAVRAAIRDLGCAVVLCHHTAKDGERERGSSALHGAMDAMIKVKKNGEHSIECFKLKDGEPWKPQQFTLIAKGPSVYVFWDGDAKAGGGSSKAHTLRDEIYQLLVDDPHDEFTSGDLRNRTGETLPNINKALRALEKDIKAECREDKKNNKKVYYWRLHASMAFINP